MQPDSIDLHALVDQALHSPGKFPIFSIVARATAAGIDVDDRAVTEIASGLGRDPRQVARVARFIENLIAPSATADVFRCVSVSCTFNGAAVLGQEIEDVLPGVSARPVHCLDQCERGPSLRVGAEVYVGGLDDVVSEERSWRDGPFLAN